MLPLVPALRTLLQGLVVPLLVLLDKAFQADVPSDFIAQVVALEQEQQP